MLLNLIRKESLRHCYVVRESTNKAVLDLSPIDIYSIGFDQKRKICNGMVSFTFSITYHKDSKIDLHSIKGPLVVEMESSSVIDFYCGKGPYTIILEIDEGFKEINNLNISEIETGSNESITVTFTNWR